MDVMESEGARESESESEAGGEGERVEAAWTLGAWLERPRE